MWLDIIVSQEVVTKVDFIIIVIINKIYITNINICKYNKYKKVNNKKIKSNTLHWNYNSKHRRGRRVINFGVISKDLPYDVRGLLSKDATKFSAVFIFNEFSNCAIISGFRAKGKGE